MKKCTKRWIGVTLAFLLTVPAIGGGQAKAALNDVISVQPSIHLTFDNSDTANTGSADDVAVTPRTVGAGENVSYVEGLNGGKALKLSGTDANNGNYLEIVKEKALDSAATGLTFVATYNIQKFEDWSRVFDFGSGDKNYVFFCPNGDGREDKNKVRAEVFNGSQVTINRVPGCRPDEWYHVAVTVGESSIKLFLNGKKIDEQSAPEWNGTIGYLGKSQYINDQYFNGLIDDFRVYESVLTENQIRTLYYNSGTVDREAAVKEPIASFDFETAAEDGYYVGAKAVAKEMAKNATKPVIEDTQINGRSTKAIKLDDKAYLQLFDDKASDSFTGLNGLDGVTVSYWENTFGNDKDASWSFFARGEKSIAAGILDGDTWSDGEGRHYLGFISRWSSARLEKQNGANNGSTTTGLPTGWRYVTLVYDKSCASLYINGEEKGRVQESSSISELLGSKQEVYLGCAPTWKFEGSKVYLDDVTIYPQAMNGYQVSAIYQKQMGNTNRVVVKDVDGSTVNEQYVANDKVVVCKSDTPVAWTINGETLAIGKTFRHVVTGDVTIEAVDPAGKEADGVAVQEGTQSSDDQYQFVANYGVNTKGNITFTFVSGAYKAVKEVPVGDYAGKQVEFTVNTGGKTIDYVVAQ